MAISSVRTPTSSTWDASPEDRRSSRTSSAATFRAPSGTSPKRTTSITRVRRTSSLMTGLSLSDGKVSMRSIVPRTSSITFSMSAPSSSSTVTAAMPSAAVASIRRTPSRPVRRSSMRRTTPSSTSPGLAPG